MAAATIQQEFRELEEDLSQQIAYLEEEFASLSRVGLPSLCTRAGNAVDTSVASIRECVRLLAVPVIPEANSIAYGPNRPTLIRDAAAAATKNDRTSAVGSFYKSLSSNKRYKIQQACANGDEVSQSTFGIFAFERQQALSALSIDSRHMLVECDRCRKRLLARAFADHYHQCVGEAAVVVRQRQTDLSLTTQSQHTHSHSLQHHQYYAAAHQNGSAQVNAAQTKNTKSSKPLEAMASSSSSGIKSGVMVSPGATVVPPRRPTSQYTNPKSPDWLLIPENEILSPEAVRTIVFHARSSNPNPMAFHRTRYQSPDPNYFI